jgi:hypothetical protein
MTGFRWWPSHSLVARGQWVGHWPGCPGIYSASAWRSDGLLTRALGAVSRRLGGAVVDWTNDYLAPTNRRIIFITKSLIPA